MVPFTAYHAYLICRNRTTLESMEGGGRVRIAAPPRSATSKPRDDVSDRLRRLAGSSVTRTTPSGGDGWKRDEQLTKEERKALAKANKLNIYNIGIKENWRTVMGREWKHWAVPIGEPEGNGYDHHINTAVLQKLESITASIRGGGPMRSASPPSDGRGGGKDHTNVGAEGRVMPISSIRGKNRVHRQDPDTQSPSASKSKRSGKQSGFRSSSGHGIVEWGAPPKKDFVLFGLTDDDIDSGGVLGSQDSHEANIAATTVTQEEQMDSDVWS
jgi:hypothetical protein